MNNETKKEVYECPKARKLFDKLIDEASDQKNWNTHLNYGSCPEGKLFDAEEFKETMIHNHGSSISIDSCIYNEKSYEELVEVFEELNKVILGKHYRCSINVQLELENKSLYQTYKESLIVSTTDNIIKELNGKRLAVINSNNQLKYIWDLLRCNSLLFKKEIPKCCYPFLKWVCEYDEEKIKSKLMPNYDVSSFDDLQKNLLNKFPGNLYSSKTREIYIDYIGKKYQDNCYCIRNERGIKWVNASKLVIISIIPITLVLTSNTISEALDNYGRIFAFALSIMSLIFTLGYFWKTYLINNGWVFTKTKKNGVLGGIGEPVEIPNNRGHITRLYGSKGYCKDFVWSILGCCCCVLCSLPNPFSYPEQFGISSKVDLEKGKRVDQPNL